MTANVELTMDALVAMSDSEFVAAIVANRPTPVREPTRSERLRYAIFRRWPETYVSAVMDAVREDDLRNRLFNLAVDVRYERKATR
jgi:hypothetical protein